MMPVNLEHEAMFFIKLCRGWAASGQDYAAVLKKLSEPENQGALALDALLERCRADSKEDAKMAPILRVSVEDPPKAPGRSNKKQK